MDFGDLNWAKHPQDDPTIPMAADLLTFEYDNVILLIASYRGYLVGDLNWFHTQIAAWDSDPKKEVNDNIPAKINDGTWKFVRSASIEDITGY